MNLKRCFCLIPGSLLLVIFAGSARAQSDREVRDQKERIEAQQQEESTDYYQKWLQQDVLYIISDDERTVFTKLTSPEEKEQFIEQFWHRRDSDLTTSFNVFKEEHYRRIAYANERFTSGSPGWKTDRGRIYIIHGPPDEIERHSAGGPYVRPPEEGGGTTTTYPFEKWWYRNIEDLGAVELEFVDPSFTGEFRLAMGPFEKDAMKFIPGLGLTESELRGETTKADRPYYYPGAYARRDSYFIGYENDPFRQLQKFVLSQRALPVRYKDLQEIVNINVTYTNLPFHVRPHYFRLAEDEVLVPITVELPNRELTFKEENGFQTAKVAIYGIVTSMTNRVITEFDDDLVSTVLAEQLDRSLGMRSVYQKLLMLDSRTRYKLDLVVKDVNSGKVGVTRQAILPPAFNHENLLSSSLLLADAIQPLPEVPAPGEMFVLGDVKIRPNLEKRFLRPNPVGVYLQIYNAAFDASTHSPSLRIAFRLLRDGETVLESVDETGESMQFFSGQRIVLIKGLPTADLELGQYRIQVEVTDRISEQSITVEESFQMIRFPAAARWPSAGR